MKQVNCPVCRKQLSYSFNKGTSRIGGMKLTITNTEKDPPNCHKLQFTAEGPLTKEWEESASRLLEKVWINTVSREQGHLFTMDRY